MRLRSAKAACLLMALAPLSGTAYAAPQPAAPAHAVRTAGDRPAYLQPDGTIAIIGNDGMDALMAGLGKLVARNQPTTRFTYVLKGSSTGLPALAADATLLAPLAREAWRGELAGFRQTHGYEALPIRIGYSGWGPRTEGKTPAAVYVARSNALPAITLTDLARVFSAGSPQGDINTWSQLGVKGEAGARRIHLYGLRDDGGFATAFRDRHFGKRPYAVRYEPLASYEAVLHAVASDPYGIGIVGWTTEEKAEGARIVPVKGKGEPALPDRQTVSNGAYPLTSGVYLYVDRAPDRKLAPTVRAWLEAALSDEGQALIAAQSSGPEGYLPLSPADLAAERAKLAAL
ncbi:PstS family phosphate ABC transporter substrate-binding protein [Novosphingobium terrae]|uniref:PstS family phosphate ABC transporter substrate-binding protein n=1 Tax=Novosphingobium terrae TaxID=2726189 RepID=UPI00197FD648|nr:substrate-binding domain-containing protein [Novosphingobium terrae]